MKYLKIEETKGYYWDGKGYQDIGQINKDGLLLLLNAAEEDDFELDIYDESKLGNKAHQVVYENIYLKFAQFLNDKSQFKTDVDNLYVDAIGKYSTDITSTALELTDNVEIEDEINLEDIPF